MKQDIVVIYQSKKLKKKIVKIVFNKNMNINYDKQRNLQILITEIMSVARYQ